MPKKKTSKKLGKFLKKGVIGKPFIPGEKVTLKGLKECMAEAFAEGDHDTVQGSIRLLLGKCECKEITRKTGLSKTALEKMCLPHPPPSYNSVDKILKFLTFIINKNKNIRQMNLLNKKNVVSVKRHVQKKCLNSF